MFDLTHKTVVCFNKKHPKLINCFLVEDGRFLNDNELNLQVYNIGARALYH